ncbi:MAG: heavy metal-associated domain-containing protein [Bacteroidota bacterium]
MRSTNNKTLKLPIFSSMIAKILFAIALVFTLCLIELKAQSLPSPVEDGYRVQIKTSAICDLCQYTLEKDLAFEKGVKEATLNLENKVMTVVYNPKKTDAQQIRKRISLVGYHADTVARDQIAYSKLPPCCKDGSHGTPVPQLPLKPEDFKQ